MEMKKVYEQIDKDGRRFVVIHHTLSEIITDIRIDFSNWYCGYMQILPTDKEYKTVKDADSEIDLWEQSPTLGDHAIGGITYVGPLPTEPTSSEVYIGFDTNHFNTQGTTLVQAVKATLDMREDLEKNDD